MLFRILFCLAALFGDTAFSAVPAPRFKVTPAQARAAVLEAFQHSWRGYANNAFGADEVGPVDGSKSFSRYHRQFQL
ncbi:hypothetical protein BGX38DRAFT_1228799 [Terfezia claveryi]|nr:hypothetical protein BGX38DRAFT_1228799 [Terfezia claveryi]